MTPLLRHKNATLSVDNTPLQEGAVAETYLGAEGTSGSSTITVKNILGFGINQILLIEDIGGENAEIILTHTSSAPSGTTVTLASNLVKTHPAGAKVRVILFNQIEFKRGSTTDAGDAVALTVTPSSTFNPASSLGSGLVSVDPTLKIQSHWSDEHTSGYYFARYKNSITSDESGYTDALAYGGWDKNTVGYAIQTALTDLGLTFSEKITRTGCYEWINECLREIEGKLIRWPDHYVYRATADTLVTGQNAYTLPANIYDNETNRSIIALRIEGQEDSLIYLDPTEFDDEYATVSTAGIPVNYTIRNSEIEVVPEPSAIVNGADLFIDYATVATSVDSDGDILDVHRYDIVKPYLAWRMKMKAKNDNNLDLNDGYYLKYKERLNDAIRTTPSPIRNRPTPRINVMHKH